jgi:hypothetical protein
MPETTTKPDQIASNRTRRYKKAAALIRKWMAEEDDYDETVWPALEQELKEGGLRCREADGQPRRDFFTL